MKDTSSWGFQRYGITSFIAVKAGGFVEYQHQHDSDCRDWIIFVLDSYVYAWAPHIKNSLVSDLLSWGGG